MQYIKIEYREHTSSPEEEYEWFAAYQVISGGYVQMYVDEDGQQIELPEPNEARVTDKDPPVTEWMILD